jgi:hypothetical protein
MKYELPSLDFFNLGASVKPDSYNPDQIVFIKTEDSKSQIFYLQTKVSDIENIVSDYIEIKHNLNKINAEKVLVQKNLYEYEDDKINVEELSANLYKIFNIAKK